MHKLINLKRFSDEEEKLILELVTSLGKLTDDFIKLNNLETHPFRIINILGSSSFIYIAANIHSLVSNIKDKEDIINFTESIKNLFNDFIDKIQKETIR